MSYKSKETERKNSAEYFTAGNVPESSVVRSNCAWITAVLQSTTLRFNEVKLLIVVKVCTNHYAKKQNNLILMDPCIVDYSAEIPTRCRFVIEFITPKFFKDSTCFERHTAHHQEL